MNCPTAQEYNEAIQNPQLNFADPELRQGQPELTPLGLPRPRSGNFATVYKLRCQQRDWAVRCFTHKFDDQQLRYAAISQQLARLNLPYMVGFSYLPQGIRISGQWFPILKMEWVEGELLDKYIARHLQNSQILLQLAERWVNLLQSLEQAGIAHGDLQHGNLMIVKGELRLIDYDGMFVPALAGRSSHEVGHQHYQHPQRTGADFHPQIDRFSGWVIYLALLALSAEPALWNQTYSGDDFILLQKSDFTDPHNSSILKQLSQHADPRVQILAETFVHALLAGLPFPPIEQALQAIQGRLRSQGDWLKDHLPTEPAPVQIPAAAPEIEKAKPETWLQDHVQHSPLETYDFQQAKISKIMLGILSVLPIASVLGIAGGWGISSKILLYGSSLSGVCSLLIIGGYAYYRNSSVTEKWKLLKQRRAAFREILNLERQIAQLQKQKHLQLRKIQRKHDKAQQQLHRQEQRERVQIEQQLQHKLSALNHELNKLIVEENAALRQLTQQFNEQILNVNQQLHELTQQEQQAVNTLLPSLQQRFIQNFLSAHYLNEAEIDGIGEKLKRRLAQVGVHSAADVEYYRLRRIDGISEHRAQALQAWHDELLQQAKKAMPIFPNQQEINGVHANFERQRQQLTERREDLQAELNAQSAECKNLYSYKRRTLEQESQHLHGETQRKLATIMQHSVQVQLKSAQDFQKLSEDYHQLSTQQEVQVYQLQQQLLAPQARLQQLKQQLQAFQQITFVKYLRWVLPRILKKLAKIW